MFLTGFCDTGLLHYAHLCCDSALCLGSAFPLPSGWLSVRVGQNQRQRKVIFGPGQRSEEGLWLDQVEAGLLLLEIPTRVDSRLRAR